MNYTASTATSGNRSGFVAAEVRAELARQRRTYTELSLDTGIPLTTLRRRLTTDDGASALSLDELERISRFLGQSPADLMAAAMTRASA